MAKKDAKMGHRRPHGSAQQQAKVDRAKVVPSHGQLSGLLRGYSLIVDGEETEVGLGMHEALAAARSINGGLW